MFTAYVESGLVADPPIKRAPCSLNYFILIHLNISLFYDFFSKYYTNQLHYFINGYVMPEIYCPVPPLMLGIYASPLLWPLSQLLLALSAR
jgi:hypothetical protein